MVFRVLLKHTFAPFLCQHNAREASLDLNNLACYALFRFRVQVSGLEVRV